MVRIKLSELNSNPFKKEINKGKLNKKIISRLKSNIKELGLMGALPVFRRDNKYFLIAGHHRVQALKETYGGDYELEVVVHDYSDENVLRGMVVENLTQRTDELVEVTENLAVIRKYLKTTRSATEHVDRPQGGGTQPEQGSVRSIYDWLNKNNKEVMSIGKISEYLKVHDNLDRSLLEKTEKIEGGIKEEKKISIEDAKMLARLEKKEQKIIKKLLDKTGLDHKGKNKLVTQYKEATEELKKKVLSGEIDIQEVLIENLKKTIKEKISEKEKDNSKKITLKKFTQYQKEAGNKVGETNDKILNTCLFLNGLEKSGVLYNLDWNTMLRIIESGNKYGKNYTNFMNKIIEVIER